MRILIIGGTGGTGQQLINQALAHGHMVTALVRNPGRLKLTHVNLKVVKGNVLDPKAVNQAMMGQEAVLSALGHKKFFIRTTLLSRGTESLIAAMKKQKVDRLICITSLGINDSRFRLGLYYTLFVIPVIVFFYFRDKEKQEKIIRNIDLNWTIVRPGKLTNGRKRGVYKHGLKAGDFIITKMISRADVAHFMLTQLTDQTYSRQAVGITY